VKLRILELGSNSFQLKGFDISAGGHVQNTWGLKRTVRLVRGLGADGQLDAEHVRRGLDAVAELLAATQDEQPLICVATSAVREAKNRTMLLSPLVSRYGVVTRVLSGDEEARLSFDGALATMTGSLGRVCVVDIGGGSTEIALGDQRGPEFTHSARVGTLLGKRALDELERQALPTLARLRWANLDHVIFASGTARALQKLLVSQGAVADGEPLPVALIESLAPALDGVPVAEFVRHGLSAERATTMPTGARLIAAVARAIGASVIDVADGGLREGVALREWRRRTVRSVPEERELSSSPRWFSAVGSLQNLVMGS